MCIYIYIYIYNLKNKTCSHLAPRRAKMTTTLGSSGALDAPVTTTVDRSMATCGFSTRNVNVRHKVDLLTTGIVNFCQLMVETGNGKMPTWRRGEIDR